MRLAFFGSAGFAVPTLSALAESSHELAQVYTQPDRKRGRGGQVRPTPVKERALALGLPVAQPATLKDGMAAAELRESAAELAVVVAYGQLIPGEMLGLPRRGFINLHASLLPRYRGAAPVPHAILNGERMTGVTVFQLNERFDTGGILAREEIEIRSDDTSGTLLERLAPLGAELVVKVIGEIQAGTATARPQDEAAATRAPKLTKESGRIDWAATADRIERLTRAFQPWPLAHTVFPLAQGPLPVALLAVAPVAADETSAAPGTVLRADGKEGIVVGCGDGAVKLVRLHPQGKRAMSGAEYMRGARLEKGTILM